MTAAAGESRCISSAPSAHNGVGRTSNIFAFLRVLGGAWILGYYLLPNTIFGRISPGGLLYDAEAQHTSRLVGAAAVLLFALANLLMARADRGSRIGKYPPMWLVTAAFGVPLAAVCVLTGNAQDMLSAVSVLTAMSTGMIAARVCGIHVGAGVTVAASVQALYAIIYQRAGVNLLLSGSVHRAGGTFNSPNHLYTLIVVALPFAIAGALEASRTLGLICYLAAASAEIAVLIMSWSRGGIIAAGCALLLMAVLARAPQRAVLACALTLAALCCAAHFVRSSGERNGVSVAGANRARLREWKAGLNAFITHPLIGVSVGDYAQQIVTERGSTSTVNVVEDPKNLIVSWLAERGLVGGILFVLFACAIVTAVRQAAPSIPGAAIAAAGAGLVVAGMVDTPFGPASRPLGNCCFGLLIGCTGLLHRKCARDPVECNPVHASATATKQGDA